jgi:putative peptide zinc metalloprotease protein
VPSDPSATAPRGLEATPGDGVPVRATGVELVGELPGSGYRKAPSLVRRADGQTIQLTRLLFLVLEAIDGRRDHAEIASVVSEKFGKVASAEDVRHLTEEKLRPLGVLREADGAEPEVKKSNPLLGLRFRYVVSDPEKTRRITAPFAALFAPVLVAVIGIAFVVAAGWVLFEKGLAAAVHQAFDKPGLILLVFALTVLSAGFHEFGHAAACRYGGATPGAMGAGLYLVWPAFYTDVNNSYSLGRAGRVRVDLGGLYFNAIFALLMLGVWAGTGWDALLLVIATQVLQMLRQLAPLVRFDGYHILADLTGVPDLYSHIKPTLLGLLPTNWRKPETKVLKPWARIVVTVWVLLVVPLLVLSALMMVIGLPRFLATAWDNLGKQAGVFNDNMAAGDFWGVGAAALSILAICVPIAGITYMLTRMVRRTTKKVLTATEERPVRRGLAGLLATALVLGLLAVWWPSGQYRPIQPGERGTVLDGISLAVSQSGLGSPAALREGQVGASTSVVASPASLGTKDKPSLALILLPHGGNGEPAWVFPFNKPDAPDAKDGNQAMAVNTTDGSSLYDVAFALVWADGTDAKQRNEAYAFASCTACRTVAVGFQVVLIVGQANVVVPENIAAAVNYECVLCVTYALAKQLVLTLPAALSPAAMASLNQVWAQLLAFGEHIEDVPLSQIQSTLDGFAQAIKTIVEQEAGSTASDSGGGAGDPGSGSDPGTTAGPGGGATTGPGAGTDPSSQPTTGPTPDPSAPASTDPTAESTAGAMSEPTATP